MVQRRKKQDKDPRWKPTEDQEKLIKMSLVFLFKKPSVPQQLFSEFGMLLIATAITIVVIDESYNFDTMNDDDKEFCQIVAFRKVRSYAAYQEVWPQSSYTTACSNSTKKLSRTKILLYIASIREKRKESRDKRLEEYRKRRRSRSRKR